MEPKTGLRYTSRTVAIVVLAGTCVALSSTASGAAQSVSRALTASVVPNGEWPGALTRPTQSIWNCNPKNIVHLTPQEQQELASL